MGPHQSKSGSRTPEKHVDGQPVKRCTIYRPEGKITVAEQVGKNAGEIIFGHAINHIFGGPVTETCEVCASIYNDYNHGTIINTVESGVRLAGCKAGAIVGGAVGTSILPGPGTALFAAIGGVFGSVGGAMVASTATWVICDQMGYGVKKIQCTICGTAIGICLYNEEKDKYMCGKCCAKEFLGSVSTGQVRHDEEKPECEKRPRRINVLLNREANSSSRVGCSAKEFLGSVSTGQVRRDEEKPECEKRPRRINVLLNSSSRVGCSAKEFLGSVSTENDQ